jgi:hypothetical protein
VGTNNLDAVGVSAAGDVEAIVVILAPGPARQDLYCCGRIHIHKTEYVCMYVYCKYTVIFTWRRNPL